MLQNQPSRTAYRVAMLRAAHQLLDAPVVFEDSVALSIVGPERAAELRTDPRRFERSVLAPYLRAFLAVRSRVTEETLAMCVAAGVRQYCVLGAGLDTFAYRNPYPPTALRVFEVDHPATQAWKRELLQEAGIPVPASLTFVPVDFEGQDLAHELLGAGLVVEEGALFSWLGVTPYLQPEAVRATLQAIADLAGRGGGVVFDYAVPPTSLGPLQQTVFERMADRVKEGGEPWRAFFAPDDLARDLSDLGFQDIEDLSGELLNERYFAGRSDGLRVGSLYHIMKALIAPPSDAASRAAGADEPTGGAC
jgi:methyltransferase (TIGR00027 family)